MKDTQSIPDLVGSMEVLDPVKLILTQASEQNISSLVIGIILFDLNQSNANSRDLVVGINYFLYCTFLA